MACISAEFATVRKDEAGVSSLDRLSDRSVDWGLACSLLVGERSMCCAESIVESIDWVLSVRTGPRDGRSAVSSGDTISSSSSLSSMIVAKDEPGSFLFSFLIVWSLGLRLSECLDRLEEDVA